MTNHGLARGPDIQGSARCRTGFLRKDHRGLLEVRDDLSVRLSLALIRVFPRLAVVALEQSCGGGVVDDPIPMTPIFSVRFFTAPLAVCASASVPAAAVPRNVRRFVFIVTLSRSCWFHACLPHCPRAQRPARLVYANRFARATQRQPAQPGAYDQSKRRALRDGPDAGDGHSSSQTIAVAVPTA